MAGILVIQVLVGVAVMGWYGSNVLKFVDDYFHHEFKKQLKAEQRKNPEVLKGQPARNVEPRGTRGFKTGSHLKQGQLYRDGAQRSDFSQRDIEDTPGYFGTRDLSSYPRLPDFDDDEVINSNYAERDSEGLDHHVTSATEKGGGTYDGEHKKAAPDPPTAFPREPQRLNPPPALSSTGTMGREKSRESGSFESMRSQSQSQSQARHPHQMYEDGEDDGEYYQVPDHHHRHPQYHHQGNPYLEDPVGDESMDFENFHIRDEQDEEARLLEHPAGFPSSGGSFEEQKGGRDGEDFKSMKVKSDLDFCGEGGEEEEVGDFDFSGLDKCDDGGGGGGEDVCRVRGISSAARSSL